MDQPQYTSLLEALAVVPDPRKARGKRYPWLLLLTLLAAGLASGQQTARAWSGSCFSQRCSGPWIPSLPHRRRRREPVRCPWQGPALRGEAGPRAPRCCSGSSPRALGCHHPAGGARSDRRCGCAHLPRWPCQPRRRTPVATPSPPATPPGAPSCALWRGLTRDTPDTQLWCLAPLPDVVEQP
jgi:hypothetical protein